MAGPHTPHEADLDAIRDEALQYAALWDALRDDTLRDNALRDDALHAVQRALLHAIPRTAMRVIRELGKNRPEDDSLLQQWKASRRFVAISRDNIAHEEGNECRCILCGELVEEGVGLERHYGLAEAGHPSCPVLPSLLVIVSQSFEKRAADRRLRQEWRRSLTPG